MEDKTPIVICPSCSERVVGRFCHHCGEKMTAGKQHLRLRNFLLEAFHELTDVDSKFFRTFRYLMLRPGFLTREVLSGKTNLYIKPFRLYVTLVVFHFLVFSNFKSGDIFQIDRFPIFTASSQLRGIIAEHELQSGMSHERFNAELSRKMKDNLSVLIYFVVFIAASGLYLMYRSFGLFYVEHLFFAFHIFSFSLLRNLLLIPVFMLDVIPLAVFITITSQVVYTFFAMKYVYPESIVKVTIKTIGFLLVLVATFSMAITVCIFLSFYQMKS